MEIKKILLGDVCEIHGRVGWKGYSVEDLRETGPLVIGANDITPNNKLDLSSVKHLSREKYEESPEIYIQKGDILVVKIGSTIGKVALVSENIGEATINPNCVIVRPTTVSPLTVYYCLCLSTSKAFLINNSKASGQSALSQEALRKLPLFIPVEDNEKALSIIARIDSKIDNNNAIAAELEGMAKDLYDYWFVQFDFPDENGKPYKSSGGKMVWNEELKREIPEGWENGIVSDLGTVVTGGTPSTGCAGYFAKSKSGHAWATPKDLSNLNSRYFYHGEADITDAGLKNSAGNIMPKGSVLFTTRAPIGYIAITANEACTNQGFKSIIPAEKFGTEFVFQTLKMLTPQMQRVGVGSTFKEVSKDVFSHQSIVIPSVNLLKKYAALTLDIAEKIRNTQEENVELTSLRDFLLPMLMNGQVKVKGA